MSDTSSGPEAAASQTVGYFRWAWHENPPPENANFMIVFSGDADAELALEKSAPVPKVPSQSPYICFGGGGKGDGAWTAARVSLVTSKIRSGACAGYSGIAYDIEVGESGLSDLFSESFSAAKDAGFDVLVTVSHSAPFGISDAPLLMRQFLSSDTIDILSPQLYSGDTGTSNDYTQGVVPWTDYADARPRILPVLLHQRFYADAVTYFKAKGVTLGGGIQWY